MTEDAVTSRPYTDLSLHELNAEHDRVWKLFCATPLEERREWSVKGYTGDSVTCRLWRQLRAINEERNTRPQHDFEADLRSVLGEGMRTDDSLAQEVYAALCNVDWEHEDGSRYSCSWRYAGGLVAEIRTGTDGSESYLDWYCSGNEGRVSERVDEALAPTGWRYGFEAESYE